MEKRKTMSQSEIDGVQYRMSSTGRIILSQGAYASMIIVGTLMTYVSYIMNTGYGIAVAVSGVILTVLTFWDGIIDPFLAKIIDNFNTRHGKLRILLTIGWVFTSAALFVMFFGLTNGGFGTVAFIIIYLLYVVGYSIFCVTLNIIPPVLTNDPMQRSVVSLWSTIVGVFPPIVFTLYVSIVLLPKHSNEYTLPMLRECCLIAVVISFVGLVMALIGLSKADKPENFEGISQADEKVSFRDMIKMFKENKALVAYVLAAVSDRLAQTMGSQSVVTTLVAGILLRNMGAYTLYSLIPMLLGFVALPFIAKINGKIGSKESMNLWSVAGMIAFGAHFAFYLAAMLTGRIDQVLINPFLLVVYLLTCLLVNICNNGNTNSTNMMIADVIDYQCYLTGKYMPAAVTATYSFIDQAVSALGSSLGLGMISLVGYTTTMPQPTDEATMPIFFVAMFMSIGVPAIGRLINVIALRMSPISREKMVEVQRVITEKRKEMED